MRLGKLDYYSDFVAYPLLVATLTGVILYRRYDVIAWGEAMAAGFTLWSLAEYWIHRVVLHRMAYFSPMHAEHHAAPRAFIGTPTWISLPSLGVAIFLPAWAQWGFVRGDGLFTGVITGYVSYGLVHHFIHHPCAILGWDFLRGARTRHLRHHYQPRGGNFGVTTSLWDHVFLTVIPDKRPVGH